MADFIKSNKDAYLITDIFERKYFSNIDISEGYLIILKDKAFYLSDARYFVALKNKLKKSNIVPKLFTSVLDIKTLLDENKIERLYLNFSKTTLKDYEKYKIFNAEILDGENELNFVRSVKTEKELSLIKKACKITEKAFYDSLKYLKVGITELEFRDILVKKYILLGAEKESFDTIVAFNKNSAVPHHETGNDKLKKDSAVLVDTGCVYKGYASDYTRTLFFGNASEKFINAYNQVKKANEEVEKTVKLGYTGIESDLIARNVLREKNLDRYFTHSLGHGVGLEIHEYPYLSKRGEDKLKLNQVFTVEPGVYFENEFGIRIEDTVCLSKNGINRFFTDSKELLIIK